ncbi:ComEC/Rec2 family competence protein [Rhizobium sp. RU36D]|uniref:ComEC/Rec2 family competence protein n=1 Tax=Rhizobium sp. RU36D TaxID=1907415 RepID=UPI0009D8E291|nr:ComEC/Rec2 family competence protein [Rhizobium sp. RU36D]SMC68493.1 ComEC/Rec2-related protein [Rhizobium sp. RU36D]
MNDGLQLAVKPREEGVAVVRPAETSPLPVRSTSRKAGVGLILSTHVGALSQRIGNAVVLEISRGRGLLFSAVLLGVGAALWFSLDAPPAAPVLAVMLAMLVAAALLLRHGAPLLYPVSTGLALLVAGMLFADAETRLWDTVVIDSPVTAMVTGQVERREAGSRGEWRYIVLVHGTSDPQIKRPPQRISVLARARHAPFALGEAITGRVRLSPPSGPALPGLNDFAFASYYNGIGAVGYFLGAPTRPTTPVVQPADTWIDRADRWLFSLRDQISTRIRTVIPGDAGAFAASIITGERRSMSNELTEALRLSGLAHITAISGLNMALAAGIFFVGLRLLFSLSPALVQSYPVKKFAATGALAGALCYLLISGYQVSAVRAFLMTAVMLVAVLFDRPAISLRNLAIAALVILAVAPSEIMGPSFQMSFAATAALIAGYAAWRERPASPPLPQAFPGAAVVNLVWSFTWGTVMTSLIGGVSTAVFAVTHFHRLAPHSLEANLLAMPVISLWVMPAGLAAMLTMPLGLDAPFLQLMGWGLELVADIAFMVAGWGEGFGFSRLSAWFLPVMALGFVLLTLLGSWLRHLGTLIMAAALAIEALTPSLPPGNILISEDGQLIGAFVGNGELATNRRRPTAFIYRQWEQALQIDTHVPPLVLPAAATEAVGPKPPNAGPKQKLTPQQIAEAKAAMQKALKMGNSARFLCADGLWCAIRLDSGWRIAAIEEPALLGAGCDTADIVVTPRRTSLKACRSGARLITSDLLRRTGSMELALGDHLKGDIKERTAFSNPQRPWMRHRLYDWRSNTFADTGPDAPVTDLSDSGG